MSGEIELVSDGDGVAVIGSSTDVERFLLSAGLEEAPSRSLDLHRLRSAANLAGGLAEAIPVVAEHAGRWVKLTEKSAKAFKHAQLMRGPAAGTARAIVMGDKGIKNILQIVTRPGTALTNPAILAGVGGIMAQLAMQQQMDEIVEYLQEINEKVDDILRGHKDAVLADMIGVDLIVEEAMTIRDRVGRVSDVTWSKVQGTGMTIARTQAYAIRQLEGIADKLQTKADLGEIAKATAEAEPKVREWLAVIARTVQLQDGVAILELDRVLDASPEDLDSHRLGLATARDNRRELIGRSTMRLLTQMDQTVQKANSKVLFNPFSSPAAVKSSNRVATGVHHFRVRLGVESGHESADAKRWGQAFTEVRDKVVTSTSEGLTTARRVGIEAFDKGTEAFREVDLDGDGIPDRARAATAAEEAGTALKGAATGVADAFGTLFKRKKEV